MTTTEPVRWVASEIDKALCRACRNGKYSLAEKALKEGGDPNCHLTLALGETIPIFVCASKGHIKIAELLEREGAVVKNARTTFDHSTPLHSASGASKIDFCKWLISRGCDVNGATKLGRTPLMEASQMGARTVVTLLCEHGAEVDAKDKDGRTALSYAVDNINKVDNRYYDSAKELVTKYGADPTVGVGRFAAGVTVLHCAAAMGDLEFVTFLVEDKAVDLKCVDDTGRTPLHYAQSTKNNQVEMYLTDMIARQNGCCVIL